AAHATKVERINVVTTCREIIHHTATWKIPRLAISPTSMYQQHRNFARMGSGFVAHVDRIIVAGDINIGELNDGLLCSGWQDAHHKHGQSQESHYTAGQSVHGNPPLRSTDPFEGTHFGADSIKGR